MFEVGKSYEFELKHGIDHNTLTYEVAEVAAWEYPLVKLRDDVGKEWVLNTASSLFIRAEEIKPADHEAVNELLKSLSLPQ